MCILQFPAHSKRKFGGRFGGNMDAQILIDKARLASEQRDLWNHQDRLSFRVGYLETTIKQLCDLLTDTEEIMYRQRELIEKIKKGDSANL
jgi:t-SNARE complex subunit (syntaxin)